MSDGGDNFSESVSGVRSSSMILLFQESELLHLKMINIKYSMMLFADILMMTMMKKVVR